MLLILEIRLLNYKTNKSINDKKDHFKQSINK